MWLQVLLSSQGCSAELGNFGICFQIGSSLRMLIFRGYVTSIAFIVSCIYMSYSYITLHTPSLLRRQPVRTTQLRHKYSFCQARQTLTGTQLTDLSVHVGAQDEQRK